MKFQSLMALFVCVTIQIHSQTNGNDHWFGTGYRIDWKNGEPSASFWDSSGHQAVGVDSAGNLMWYANIYGVFDRRGVRMPNSYNYADTWGGGVGTGANGFVFASLENPDFPNLHYLLVSPDLGYYYTYTDTKYLHSATGPAYFEIDMNKNSGYGDLVKNNLTYIFPDTSSYSGMALTRHANGKDFWVITAGNASYSNYTASPNKLYWSAKITGTGIQNAHSSVSVFSTENSAMNFNNKGTMLLDYLRGIGAILLNFDQSSGDLSNFKKLCNSYLGNASHKNSYIFTPNDSFLIVEGTPDLRKEFYNQISENDSGILAIPIYEYPTLANSFFYRIDKFWFQDYDYSKDVEIGNWSVMDMQYGVDGKLYIHQLKYDFIYKKWYLACHIIHNPGKVGVESNLEINGLYSPVNLNIRYYKYAEYFTFRIPSKYARIEIDSFYCNTYFNNKSHIDFNKFIWYWGDGDSTITSSRARLQHYYSNSGKYRVKLKAILPSGRYAITWQDVNIVQKPIAHFSVQDSLGCQYVQFRIYDSTKTGNTTKPNLNVWRFYYGDGKDSILKSPFSGKLDYTYKYSGLYNLKLIFSNGQCADTFMLIRQVKIAPATQAQIAISNTENCIGSSSELYNKYSNNIDTVKWLLENNIVYSTKFDGKVNYFWQNSGMQKVKIWVKDKSGCLTSDSIYIRVKQGFIAENARLKLVTVDALNRIHIYSNKHTATENYSYFHNGILSKITKEDSLVSNLNSSTIYDFTIEWQDSCDKSSGRSNVISNIVLNGKIVGDSFEFDYNAYNGFKVKNYTIEYLQSVGNYQAKATNSKIEQKLDANPYPNPVSCFRVKASCDTCSLVSYSNTVCIEKDGKLYLPNTFTPNGDGKNETWQPVLDGLVVENLLIFNRWGQKVFEGSGSQISWDGTYNGQKCDAGVYAVLILASNKIKKLELRHTITLLS